MSRPSDSFEPDELKEEFDWMYEFDSRMAERITHDPDVHNLVDYVNKLESENAKLRDEFRKMDQWHSDELMAALDENKDLRNILGKMYHLVTELCVISVDGRRIGPACTISPSALSHLAEKLRDIGVDVGGTYEGDRKEQRRLQGIIARLTAHFRAGSR